MRYRLLLIDHDDTAVDSTAVVHYPAHLEALRVLRPGLPQPTIEQWWLANFDPGIMEHLVHALGMNEAELAREFEIWRSFTASRMPPFFPGFRELLCAFRDRGGRVAVVSHSERENILRDYRQPGSPPFEPDLVFGWDHDPARRKPDPWPARAWGRWSSPRRFRRGCRRRFSSGARMWLEPSNCWWPPTRTSARRRRCSSPRSA